jgi:hypothetical protein
MKHGVLSLRWNIGTLGVNRVVMEAQIPADLIEKFRLFWCLT